MKKKELLKYNKTKSNQKTKTYMMIDNIIYTLGKYTKIHNTTARNTRYLGRYLHVHMHALLYSSPSSSSAGSSSA